MKLLYQELRAALESGTSVQHVRLWNNQVELSEKKEQIPFQTPAIFIDFPSIEWSTIGKGKQNAQLMTRLYCVFESFATDENEEDLQVFTFRQEVYLVAQKFKATQTGSFQRVSEQTDPNHTNLYVWIMDFTSTYTDIDAEDPRGGVDTQINTLILDTDLIINSNTVDGVRTDEKFN